MNIVLVIEIVKIISWVIVCVVVISQQIGILRLRRIVRNQNDSIRRQQITIDLQNNSICRMSNVAESLNRKLKDTVEELKFKK